MAVKPIPEGYHSVTPYLTVKGAAKALEFYKRSFGATEVMRMDGPNGTISHAEIKIGDSHVMLSDEFPEKGMRSPESYGGTPVGIMIYVPDVDGVHGKAVANGAKVEQAPENQFYGDRSSCVVDPFGHRWFISTHVEDVSMEEMEKRMAAMKR